MAMGNATLVGVWTSGWGIQEHGAVDGGSMPGHGAVDAVCRRDGAGRQRV